MRTHATPEDTMATTTCDRCERREIDCVCAPDCGCTSAKPHCATCGHSPTCTLACDKGTTDLVIDGVRGPVDVHGQPLPVAPVLTPMATSYTGADEIHVEVTWSARNPDGTRAALLDRPHTFGWAVSLGHGALARRLLAAINAGAVYSNPRIVRDCNGATYVQADSVRMLGRTLNADLRRIGF